MTDEFLDKPRTTGAVARLMGNAARTVVKWLDSGKLKGFRVPGSLDRRTTWRWVLEMVEGTPNLEDLVRRKLEGMSPIESKESV